MKTKPAKRFRLVSAPVLVALVLVLTVGVAFAGVYGHKIQELIMPGGQSTGTISLQGYADSPEYIAAAEYMESGEEAAPKDIAEKYGLKLHDGEWTVASADKLYKVFGDFASCDNGAGYYYKDGTLHLDGEETVDGRLIDYQFVRTMKGVFDTVYLDLGDVNRFEQWEYETANGDAVLLALSDDQALIITDYDNCFIAVNVLCGTDEPFVDGGDTITKKHLEGLADSFSFSVLSSSKFSLDEDAAETDEATDEQSAEAASADPEFKFECSPVDDSDAVISKRYGNVSGKLHEGIDFAASEGTAIHAVADGKAKVWESDADYGNYVIIDHDNGWCTVYAHCETILVEDGASVKSGDEIATVGSTGKSTGPHLHFELRCNSGPVDPDPYIKK